MSNEIDKYSNLNAQLLYDKFEARYNIKYKSIRRKCFDDFKLWFKSYYKSELFVFFIIMFISTLICFLYINLIVYIKCFACVTFQLFYMFHYRLLFRF